jgi:hypothetical protein
MEQQSQNTVHMPSELPPAREPHPIGSSLASIQVTIPHIEVNVNKLIGKLFVMLKEQSDRIASLENKVQQLEKKQTNL